MTAAVGTWMEFEIWRSCCSAVSSCLTADVMMRQDNDNSLLVLNQALNCCSARGLKVTELWSQNLKSNGGLEWFRALKIAETYKIEG